MQLKKILNHFKLKSNNRAFIQFIKHKRQSKNVEKFMNDSNNANVYMSENKQIVLDRIDFKNGGSLDGPLLLQTLYRLRNTELAITALQTKNTFIDYVPSIPMSAALSATLLFLEPREITDEQLQTAEINSIYNFGNTSNGFVTISDGNAVILTIVPGEFVSLIRRPTRWIGTFIL